MPNWTLVCFSWEEESGDKTCFWIPEELEFDAMVKQLQKYAESTEKDESLQIEKVTGYSEEFIRKVNTMPIGNDYHGIVTKPAKLDVDVDFSSLMEQLHALC